MRRRLQVDRQQDGNLTGGEVAALMHEAEMHIVPELERLKSTQFDRHKHRTKNGHHFWD
jgi:hypothetical protein